MSLDLSYNNLVELVELIEKLATLPKLQNLVLLGNPLSVSMDSDCYINYISL